jgi:DNA polymerase elongation subunit (family B)
VFRRLHCWQNQSFFANESCRKGVLLRALQSLDSEERGSKRGKQVVKADVAASTSLSEESKSQATSPWKKRRRGPMAQQQNENPRYGYFFFSPSLQDTEKQEALEVQALTLEPQSGHYVDPVVVCDFTALYPSVMIAYNLCYSTCAGKLDYKTTRPEMLKEGKTTSRVGPYRYSESRTATVLKHHLKSFNEASPEADGFSCKDRAYVAPTGAVYVSEAVVKGVLPQVLDELLSTRAMLKKAAKLYKKRVTKGLSPSILRQLEARQLAYVFVEGEEIERSHFAFTNPIVLFARVYLSALHHSLKYVANVTYGKSVE